MNQAELDPRVRRTRRMLQDALAKLLGEKEFDRISIGDITDSATLNRATFYDHYQDKFALLECLVASRFRDLIAKRRLRFDSCEGAVKAIALAVCDYLTEMPGASAPSASGKSLETAIVAVVRGMILDGLTRHGAANTGNGTGAFPRELLAATAAWAIYGAASEWLHMPERMPAERIAGVIETMVAPILALN